VWKTGKQSLSMQMFFLTTFPAAEKSRYTVKPGQMPIGNWVALLIEWLYAQIL